MSRELLTKTKSAANQIAVWFRTFESLMPQCDAFARLLSPEELSTTARFKTEILQKRYVIGRGFLRSTLGEVLDCEPSSIEFAYNQSGKPELANAGLCGAVHFNVSHSHDVLALAISPAHAVGIDVEYVDQRADVSSIAKRFFSRLEFEHIEHQVADRQREMFFQLWTRKESIVKAYGKSLFSDTRSETHSVVHQESVHSEGGLWLSDLLVPFEGYKGALALIGVSDSQWVETICYR